MTGLLGGLLLLVGGGLLGYGATAQMGRRLDAIAAIRGGLYALERELSQQLTPLPTLLQRNYLPFSSEFSACGQGVQEGVPFTRCWDRLVDALPQLEGEERGILRPLGGILGRFEGEVQSAALLRTAEELERLEERLRENRFRLGRVYPALGMTAGAFFAIVLG